MKILGTQIHPKYNDTTSYYDVAVVRTSPVNSTWVSFWILKKTNCAYQLENFARHVKGHISKMTESEKSPPHGTMGTHNLSVFRLRRMALELQCNNRFPLHEKLLGVRLIKANVVYLIRCLWFESAAMEQKHMKRGRVPPWHSGFVCACHPAAPGPSPKHTIYAFTNLYWLVSCREDKNK